MMTARSSNDQAPIMDEFIPQQVDRSGHLGRQMSIDGDQYIQKTAVLGSATRINDSGIDSSVIFAENNDDENGKLKNEDDTLFSEVDELCPHAHEGGEIKKEPKLNKSMNSYTSSVSSSQLKASFHSFASSLRQSSRRSSSPAPSDDLQALLNSNGSSNDTSQHKRSSIVGGKHLSDMTFDEKREIFAPERSRDSLVITDNHESNRDDTTNNAGLNQSRASRTSVYAPISTGGGLSANGMVSSIDWSSLTKSCKRAKESMRDAMSCHVVVKNMFSTHFTALTAVLALYAKRCSEKGGMANQVAMEDVLTRTIETKRAIRFAISCLAPFSSKSDLYDESARQMRQDLQQVAVEGICSSEDAGSRHGLHVFLAELIRYSPINYEEMIDVPGGEKWEVIVSSLEKNQLSVRTLAARLLCNIVTDNSVAAGIVLLDIPFSPTKEQLEERMSGQVLELNHGCRSDDSTMCWTDLIHKVSQIRTKKKLTAIDAEGGDCFDREVLAAVVAALHNLLVSIEMRGSLEEIDSEMKRIEELRRLRNINRGKSVDEDCGLHRRGGNEPMKSVDALFEVASNSSLINILLRSVIPAHSVLNMIKPNPTSPVDSSRPKFVPPVANDTPVLDHTSDSATEWISLVLERLVSRGLVLQVLHSAGGSGETTTPEQVVLMSCIRQAMNAYQSSMIPANGSSEFDMRRLSIVAKSSLESVPHPLWGRGDGLRTAVPVLISLTNELEKVRNRALILKSPFDRACEEEYEGELNCINYIIHDILDILGQCLGKNSSQLSNDQSIMTEARSVLGRDTNLLRHCCEDLALIVDASLASNYGKSARELSLSLQEQETATSTVRLIGNLIHHCRHNQDLLRTTVIRSKYEKVGGGNNKDEDSSRTGLHVLLSATSLGPACFTLREWCIVAIRNAVENNEDNIELVKQLEANAALADTPELKKIGLKVELDAKGNVVVQKREADGE